MPPRFPLFPCWEILAAATMAPRPPTPTPVSHQVTAAMSCALGTRVNAVIDLATVSILLRTIRRVLRPLARPFLRPLIRRIERLEDRVDGVNDLAVRLDHHLPIVESLIESQNSTLRVAARDAIALRAELDRLRSEVEALRARPAVAALPVSPPAAQVAGQRLAAGDGDLRLEFGSDSQCLPDHVSVDLRALRGQDLAAELRALPFGDRSTAGIRASLVLERFSVGEVRDVLLPCWHSLLRPGGSLVVVGGDAEASLLERLLAAAGFESIQVVAGPPAGDGAHQVEVTATRRAQGSTPAGVVSRTGVRA
jgi:hypothetical protein